LPTHKYPTQFERGSGSLVADFWQSGCAKVDKGCIYSRLENHSTAYQTSDEFFIFQQDAAPANCRTRRTINLLARFTAAKFSLYVENGARYSHSYDGILIELTQVRGALSDRPCHDVVGWLRSVVVLAKTL